LKNERDTSVVPELAELSEGCNITFADPPDGAGSWYFDSQYGMYASAYDLLDIEHGATEAGRDHTGEICAVVAPVDANANMGVSVLASHLRIPQVSYATMDYRLSHQHEYPYYVSMLPNSPDFARTLPLYLQRDIWQRDYVAILYEQSPFGTQFEHALVHDDQEGEDHKKDAIWLGNISEGFVEEETGQDDALRSSLKRIQQSGYRTVVLVTDKPHQLSMVARIADSLNMLGDDNYFWILPAGALPPSLLSSYRFQVDSPMDRLLRGSALLANYDPFMYIGADDKFLRAWRMQNSSLVSRVNRIQPSKADGDKFYIADDSYFQEVTPTVSSSFMFDAVIAIGIGACIARGQNGDHEGDHVGSILESRFGGASGTVVFKHGEGFDDHLNGRDPRGTTFGVYNVRAKEIDEDTGLRG